jgi:hypothetical protein
MTMNSSLKLSSRALLTMRCSTLRLRTSLRLLENGEKTLKRFLASARARDAGNLKLNEIKNNKE